jgi:acyl-coenzyme A thioesterase PaaI-like protein
MQVAVVKASLGALAGHMPTIHLDVDYVAPAPLGSWVDLAVSLVKNTRNLIFTQALITADGHVVARSSGIYRNPIKGRTQS